MLQSYEQFEKVPKESSFFELLLTTLYHPSLIRVMSVK